MTETSQAASGLVRYRYRMYPTAPQRRYLARLFGCIRVVYNDYLRVRQEDYQRWASSEDRESHKPLAHGDIVKQVVTQAKQTEERGWLREVHSQPLLKAPVDAKTAYDNFFKSCTGKRKGPKMGFPRFKRKSGRGSAYFARSSNPIKLNLTTHGVGIIQFPAVGRGKDKTRPLHRVRFTYHRQLPEAWSSVTIIKESDGSYWLSFVAPAPEVEPEAPVYPGRVAGLDAGIGNDLLAVVYSDGSREKVGNPREYRTGLRRLKKAQRALSRRQGARRGERQSQRYKRQALKVAKLHAKMRNRRDYHHHVLSKKLVTENSVVGVETLSLKGMARTRLAKSVNDAAIGGLYLKLDYKARAAGCTFTKVGQWEPTTRTCSVCGTCGDKKPLHIRKWVCDNCGTMLDRDYNAAVNVLLAAREGDQSVDRMALASA